MKILLVNNVSLNQEKFKEQNQILFQAAKDLEIELEIKNNAEIFYTLNESTKIGNYDGILFYDKDIFLCRKLEKMGFKVFNSSLCIANCDNKALTYEILSNHNIPFPKTILLPLMFYYDEKFIKEFINYLETEINYPMIAKKWYGSEGKQVYLIKNHEELLKLLDDEQGKELLFQEFVSECTGQDIRLVVIDNKVVTSMKRHSVNGDFRSNLSNGAVAEMYSPTEEEINIAISASKALGCEFCGIDILQSNRGPIICEVNSNAHLKNIYECTGINIAKHILSYIKEKLVK